MVLGLVSNPSRVVAALAVLAGLVGCDGSRDGPRPEELRSLIELHCDQVQACGCATTLTASTCTETLSERWNERVSKGDARGLRYDAECFATLVDDVERFQCYQPGGPTPLCASFCAIYHGEVELGDACQAVDAHVSDCAQGLLCHEGSCVEPCTVLGGRLEGERCADPNAFGNFDDCAQGLSCAWDPGTCERLATEGQSCFDRQCAEGLYCDWQTERCAAAAAEGERCDEVECAPGLYCGWDTEQRRCRAHSDEGERCSDARCRDDLVCNEANVCTGPPLSGEPCLYGSICAQGLRCDFELVRCAELPLRGEPCLQGECGVGSWCEITIDDPEGTCVAPVEVGQPCSGHLQCTSGFCPNGFCWARPTEGESCEDSQVCAPGLVCNGALCEPTLTRAPAACSYPGW